MISLFEQFSVFSLISDVDGPNFVLVVVLTRASPSCWIQIQIYFNSHISIIWNKVPLYKLITCRQTQSVKKVCVWKTNENLEFIDLLRVKYEKKALISTLDSRSTTTQFRSSTTTVCQRSRSRPEVPVFSNNYNMFPGFKNAFLIKSWPTKNLI